MAMIMTIVILILLLIMTLMWPAHMRSFFKGVGWVLIAGATAICVLGVMASI